MKKYSPQLCPNCKKSADSYLLDNKNPFCSHLHLHTGTSSIKFIKAEITETEVNTYGKRLQG